MVKKARVEDALRATRSAVEEGILPCGGVYARSAVARRDAMVLRRDLGSLGLSLRRPFWISPPQLHPAQFNPRSSVSGIEPDCRLSLTSSRYCLSESKRPRLVSAIALLGSRRTARRALAMAL